MLKQRWCFETLFFLGLWLILVGLFPTMLFRDPGTFWHTTIGLQILDSGHVPTADTFTYTVHGRPWVSQDWLCQLGMGWLYRLGGWDCLLVVTATVIGVFYAWLAGRLVSAGLAAICAVLLAAMALAAGTPQFHIRPLVLTLVLTGFTFAFLIDVEAGRRPLRQLWWFVPMFVVWTNLHGGVLGGLGTFVLVAGGWMLWAICGRESPVRCRRDGIELAGILAACGLTVLINPYGPQLPRLWFEILRLPLSELIREHAPLWQVGAMAWVPTGLLLLYLVVVAGAWPRFPRVTWWLPLVWFVLACSRSRHAALFGVVGVLALADVLPYSRCGQWLARRGFWRRQAALSDEGHSVLGWQRVAVPAVLVGVASLLQALAVPAPLLGQGWVQLDPAYWPVQLLPQLRELETRTNGEVRIFNDYLYGGFLIFHTPALPVFMDDRCELFGEAFLRRNSYLCFDDASEIDRWDAQFGFSHALVEGQSKLDRYLAGSAAWETIRRTPTAVLYRKQSPGIVDATRARAVPRGDTLVRPQDTPRAWLADTGQ